MMGGNINPSAFLSWAHCLNFLAYETLFDALVVTKLPLITTYNHL
jgi:hypothetical protein